jgi:hypothetical protein
MLEVKLKGSKIAGHQDFFAWIGYRHGFAIRGAVFALRRAWIADRRAKPEV